MNDFQASRRRRVARWYFSYWVLAILVLAAFGLARGTYDNYQKSQRTGQDLLIVGNELADLKERQSFLASKLSRLRTGEGLDEEIRKNFPVAGPGEKVIVIIDDQTELISTTSTSTNSGFSVKRMLGL